MFSRPTRCETARRHHIALRRRRSSWRRRTFPTFAGLAVCLALASCVSTAAAPDPSVRSRPPATRGAIAVGGTLELDHRQKVRSSSIPSICQGQPTTLVGGEDVERQRRDGYFFLLDGLASGDSAWITFREAGQEITAVVARCNAGGVEWSPVVLFFDATGDNVAHSHFSLCKDTTNYPLQPEEICLEHEWPDGVFGTGRNGRSSGILNFSADGETFDVLLRVELDTDGACCPSALAQLRIDYETTPAGDARLVVIEALSFTTGVEPNSPTDLFGRPTS